jgi:hypothetical protein
MKQMKQWFWLAIGALVLVPQVACAQYPAYYTAARPVYVARPAPPPAPWRWRAGYADLNRDGWVSPREHRIVQREMRREARARANMERSRSRAYDRGWR